MSKNAPDFSESLSVLEDKVLSDAEMRLDERRMKVRHTEVDTAPRSQRVLNNSSTEGLGTPEVHPAKSRRKRKRQAKSSSGLHVVERAIRRNLTLKVLEENERRFNELFHRMQLRGDARKKQDLADEACRLLFEKYDSVFQAK